MNQPNESMELRRPRQDLTATPLTPQEVEAVIGMSLLSHGDEQGQPQALLAQATSQPHQGAFQSLAAFLQPIAEFLQHLTTSLQPLAATPEAAAALHPIAGILLLLVGSLQLLAATAEAAAALILAGFPSLQALTERCE